MKSNNNHLQPYMRQDQNNPHKVLDFYKFHHLGLTPILLKHSLEQKLILRSFPPSKKL